MSLNRQSEYYTRLNRVAGEALLNLREKFSQVYFYFVEPEMWLFLFEISQQYCKGIHVLEITSNIVIKKRPPDKKPCEFLAPEDPIIYIGRPTNLSLLCQEKVVKSRENPIIFATIPNYSHLLKSEIWRMPINFKGFTSFCFPFLPYKHFLKISVGSFKRLFLFAPLFESKALKTVLLSLAFIFGRFDRVYAAGDFSAGIARGFLDICRNPEIPPGRNNLILLDRTIDMQSLMNINNSYIGILEELDMWDQYGDKIKPNALSNMLEQPIRTAMELPIATCEDQLFEKLNLLTLSDARRNVSLTDFRNTTTENLVQDHTKVLDSIYKKYMKNYFIDLVMKIQRNQIDAKKFGRCVSICPDGPSLAFRMLSSLHYSQNKDSTNSIASLLSYGYGITMFSKWNQIDEIAMKTEKILPPKKLAGLESLITTISALLGQILTDEWKRPNLPVKDSYVSNSSPLPADVKYRWFVGVIGGMTTTELKIFKQIAKICRPNDDFVFMSTDLMSARKFMEDALKE